jgi:hypothetical protein
MSDETEKLQLKLEEPAAESSVGDAESSSGINTDEDFRQANEVLKQQLESHRRELEQARYREQYAAQTAQKALQEKVESDYHLVNNAKDRIKADQTMLKSMMSEAYSSGDFDRVAEIQEAMQRNINTMRELETGAEQLKSQPLPTYRPPAPPPQVDVIENLARMVEANNSLRSAQWLRMNKQYLQDQKVLRKMERAHYDALDDGIAPETDEYFSYVENRLGLNRRSQDVEEGSAESPLSSASAPTQRRAAPPAAPVSRSGTGTGGRSNAVRLTPDQREAAKFSGLTEQQYWDQLQRAKKNGEISTH